MQRKKRQIDKDNQENGERPVVRENISEVKTSDDTDSVFIPEDEPVKNETAETQDTSMNRKKIKTGRNPWLTGLKIFALVTGTSAGVIIGFAVYFSQDLPSISQLEVYEPKLSTKVYSSDGKIIKEFYKERRTRIPYNDIPKPVIHALLATEDHRFYDHWGVDLIRAVKAAMVNLTTMSSREGFSSLTQQLSRNLYFDFEKTLTRKFKEILTAIQIERTYSKNEIIEMYLTHMYFGNQAYGIHSAAKIFFNKDVSDLNLNESAYLIGLLQAPTYYVKNYKAAANRKNIVLRRMLDCDYITEKQFNDNSKKDLVFVTKKETDNPGSAPYFTEHIRLQLESMKDSLKFNIYEDGLSVFTTLNTKLQSVAEKALEQSVIEKFSGLDKFGAKVIKNSYKTYLTRYLLRDGYSQDDINTLLSDTKAVDSLCQLYGTVQTGFVALDPTNGYILAMIGGRNFNQFKLNHVTQIQRQAGSTFKPFLYTVAVDNGYSPSFKVLNQDVVLIMEDGTRWTPQNYDGSRGGPTTLREALAKSLNLVSVRLMQEVVPVQEVVKLVAKMGLSTPMPAVDALALGVSDVIPLEMVSAYSIFANKGVRTEPVSILKIEDRDGNILWQYTPRRKEVLSPATAYIMTDMMKSGIDAETGTGRFARRYGFDRPAAVKTGTTQKWTDGWFIGYTPNIAAGVWVGYDSYEFNLGSKNPGAIVASPLWGRFMAEAHKELNLPVDDFEMPPDIVRLDICEESGLLANAVCPKKVNEVFHIKYQPTDMCTIHTGVSKSVKKKKSNRY